MARISEDFDKSTNALMGDDDYLLQNIDDSAFKGYNPGSQVGNEEMEDNPLDRGFLEGVNDMPNESIIMDNNKDDDLFDMDEGGKEKASPENVKEKLSSMKKNIGRSSRKKFKSDADRRAEQNINDGMRQVNNAMKVIDGWSFTPSVPQRSKPNLWRRFWDSVSHGAVRVVKAVSNFVAAPIVAIRYTYAKNKLLKATAEMEKRRNRELVPGWDGATYEKKLDDNGHENGWDMLDDVRRVPVVWSYLTAEKAEKEPGVPADPEVSVYIEQPKANSSQNFKGMEIGHAMIGIHYSRKRKSSNRIERYGIQYGYYPAGGMTTPSMSFMMTDFNTVLPGMLKNDRGHVYTISRRYKATEEQVGKILKASEKYSDKGYGYYKRNCTTFVRDMIVKEANLDTDGTIFEKEAVRFNFGVNFLRGLVSTWGSFSTANVMSDLADISKKEDLNYVGYGGNRVTAKDVANYNKSRDYHQGPEETYIPSVTGENLRRINENERTGGTLGAYYYAGTMGKDFNKKKESLPAFESNLRIEGNNMTEKFRGILPPGNVPRELMTFVTGGAFKEAVDIMHILNARVDEYFEKTDKEYDDKGNEIIPVKSPFVYEIFKADDIREAREILSNNQKYVSSIYSNYFGGDLRVSKEVMQYLSILEMSIYYLDRLYADTLSGERINGRLENTYDQMYFARTKVVIGDDITEITPSWYEAYLQVYKDPAEAVKNFKKYMELSGIKKKDRSKTQNEQLTPLERKHNLAKDYYRAHMYLLEKDKYSQQDINYIYNLAVLEKKGHASVGSDNDSSSSASRIYRKLLLSNVFGDIGKEWQKDEAEGGAPVSRSQGKDREQLHQIGMEWLESYFLPRIENNKEMIRSIARAMKKAHPGQADEIYIYDFFMDIYYMFVIKVKAGSDDEYKQIMTDKMVETYNYVPMGMNSKIFDRVKELFISV